MKLKQRAIDNFLERLEKSGDCWLWTGKKIKAGYGTLMMRRKLWRIHRFSWVYHNGDIPE